jgi:hypothetical protein
MNVAGKFKATIEKYRSQGIPVIGFGAPAKGNTLMNFAGIGPDFTIDENPLKQGLHCPGVDVPIYGMEGLNAVKDIETVCFIPLAWNFYNEIHQKITSVRPGKKDIFVRYFPEFQINHTNL